MSGACNRADMHARFTIGLLAALGLVSGAALTARNNRSLEAANPVRPSPRPPLGIDGLDELPSPPAPERVRLGRWLFYDTRLSGDGTVARHIAPDPFALSLLIRKGASLTSGVAP